MKKLAIKAENISKQYRLGEVGTGTLSHDLNRMWYKMRGKEDPYLKIGESNDRSRKGDSDYVWSLKDINFEIEQGDAVGIIGKNGAGKSTLLKILSKVTKPTTGNIKVNCRIASLLEVGTGFNPEMTGRENIYLNGAILGMRRAEITRKLDEIIDFSGVERYIDTPVKRYSSGMYVRLAFAVAAHLESEILIIDEVLAVGDAEFQKKCLGKMGDVSKGEGRTVLFVSHNMAAVTKLCNKAILLTNGNIGYDNITYQTIKYYIQSSKFQQNGYISEFNVKFDKIKELKLISALKSECYIYDFNEVITLVIKIKVKDIVSDTFVGFTVMNTHHQKIFSDVKNLNYTNKIHEDITIEVEIPSNVLLSGIYMIDVALFASDIGNYDYVSQACTFEITDFNSKLSVFNDSDIGNVMVNCNWNIL
jgi:lipopolysaccharide transport system ATP-binding protein